MDVDPWNRFMDCFTNLHVGVPGVTWMNSSLETDFAGTTIPGLPCSGHDFIELKVIGFTSKIFLEGAIFKDKQTITLQLKYAIKMIPLMYI